MEHLRKAKIRHNNHRWNQNRPMIRIELTTRIAAPILRCFDLARSIDAHVASTGPTQEQAIAGRTTGLINVDETVTWRARHLGVMQTHTSKITAFESPVYFQDTMQRGTFKSFQHDHRFVENGPEDTTMLDTLVFAAPLGPLGWLAERFVLRRHLTRFLAERNAGLKTMAESEAWRGFLDAAPDLESVVAPDPLHD